MKIILSRKGFDSGYGQVPSPIFPGNQMVSLPIPSADGIPAEKCSPRGHSLGEILCDLTHGRLGAATTVHLDPDLDPAALPRFKGWRPAFGQASAAQTHLQNQGVGVGDLFLFFGWFRPVHRQGGRWVFRPDANSFHALFGWLQVGEVVRVDPISARRAPAWLQQHPHVTFADRFAGSPNAVYVGSDTLTIPGCAGVKGAGAYSHWSPRLTLTASGCSRSIWSVPRWMAPRPGIAPLSYHGNPNRWSLRGEELLLSSVAKGQEFVLDTRYLPEASEWAAGLIKEHV